MPDQSRHSNQQTKKNEHRNTPANTTAAGAVEQSSTKATIGNTAVKLAWKIGTKSYLYHYPGGSPTKEFQKAIALVGKNYHFWSDHSRKGASCDVFVGVSVRYSGYDKDFPLGITSQYKHMNASKKWKQIKYDPNKSASSQLQSGDVMCLRRQGAYKHAEPCPSHMCMVVKVNGKFKTAEAHAGRAYGAIASFKSGKGYKWVKVYRATDPNFSGGDVTGMFMDDEATGDTTFAEVDNGAPIVLKDSIESLYSSANYSWASSKDENSKSQENIINLRNSVRTYLQNTQITNNSLNNIAPTDVVVKYTKLKSSKEFIFKPDLYKSKGGQRLSSYPNLIQAPTIMLSFNGITIGGYNNVGDKFPNYINSMTVSKINGRINKYVISLTYQVRSHEDPNFIDSLLGRTGYTRPLKIIYGDSFNPGLMYREEQTVITDVKSKANVSSSTITYTIEAISSVASSAQTYHNFVQVIDKPSTVINDLLYNSGQVSTELLNAFPLMSNRTYVNSHNLIPTTDTEVIIGGMQNVSPLTYLGHVVSCMYNSTRNSSYFLSYNDGVGGAYFKVSEVSPNSMSNTLYEVDVGYPGDNFVTDFQLSDNIYWPLVYQYNDKIPKWEYEISNKGEIIKTRTNSLLTDNKYMSTSIINSNWWKSVTEFPISAKLTLKGLTAPVMLMTYIRVNTLFYGQKDLASGLYVVVAQDDSISGSGCTTTLTLLRVGS